jgi:hypothetical protein
LSAALVLECTAVTAAHARRGFSFDIHDYQHSQYLCHMAYSENINSYFGGSGGFDARHY